MLRVSFAPRILTAFLVVVTIGMGFWGCSSSSHPVEVRVGQPEVFTRQRLVNRRLTEQSWLESQLALTPTTPSFQGFRDLRTFEGLYNKTNVSLDPLGGKLATAQNTLSVQGLQNQADINALQHQIDMLKLQQQLTALQQTTPTSTSAPSSPGTSSSSNTSTPSSTSSPSTALATPQPSGIFSNAPPLPSPADIVTTQAKLTSVEFLRDQLAYRNAIQAALREQELDDSHDLAGQTLYTLKFDISVVPHGKSDGYVKVRLNTAMAVMDDAAIKTCADAWKSYYRWFWNLRAAIHVEAVALQRRMELNLLTEEERIRLAAYATSTFPGDDKVAEDTRRDILSSLMQFLARDEKPAKDQQDPLEKLKRAGARLVQKKYETSLGELVHFEHVLLPQLDLDGKKYYAPNIPDPKPCPSTQVTAFIETLTKLRRTPKVFATDPKEEAQNISDVAAIEQLRNVVLALQATLPQYGVSGSNYTEYMNRSQQRLQGILRRPLLVAYSDRGEAFGWILGPRFEIDSKGKPVFNHTTAQHSVQVSLLVPGWVRSLTIPYETFWIDSKGHSQRINDYCESLGPPTSNNAGGTQSTRADNCLISLKLPGDDTVITSNLLAQSGERRTPFIEPPTDSKNQLQTSRLQANKPADLIIRGRQLWRSPRVFLGGQPANQVLLLPDMNGLSAHFDSVVMPPSPAKVNPVLDLSVVTSEGIATIPGAVQIYPDATVPPDKFILAIETPRVFPLADSKKPSLSLTLSAPAEAVPDAFNRLAFSVRPLLPGEDPTKIARQFQTLPGEVRLVKQDKKILFVAPVQPPDFQSWRQEWVADFTRHSDRKSPQNGWIMQADLSMAASPGAPLKSIASADGKPLLFAFFPDERRASGVLAVSTSSSVPRPGSPLQTTFLRNAFNPALVISLGGDDVFAQAYPGLKQALQLSLMLRVAEVKIDAPEEELGSTTATLTSEHFELIDERKRLPGNHAALDELLANIRIVINSLPGATNGGTEKDSTSKHDAKKEMSGPAGWLAQRIADGKEHRFKVSILVSPDVTVPVNPIITIKSK